MVSLGVTHVIFYDISIFVMVAQRRALTIDHGTTVYNVGGLIPKSVYQGQYTKVSIPRSVYTSLSIIINQLYLIYRTSKKCAYIYVTQT